MDWLATAVLELGNLGEWAPVVFVACYVVAALTLVPVSFLLTVSAGAMFGVWWGSALVFIGASLGASLVYAIASPLAGSRWMQSVTRDRRVDVVRTAVAGESVHIMFLLRLSPITPYSIVNYALALSGVRFSDFVAALPGMLPVIIMSSYYGKVVGDVAALAAGVAPPRGPEYYTLLLLGLIITIVSTMLIMRASRRAIERHRHR
jgi:uncharacterized membrane protein YdjX (TVP38/TMEM64 family)